MDGYGCSTTTGGIARGAGCKFPFIHKGVSYSQCTTKGHHNRWCYTTNKGKWGYCNALCDTYSGSKLTDDVQKALEGQSCKAVTKDNPEGKCWEAMMWIKSKGLLLSGEQAWAAQYIKFGLKSTSPMSDFQRYLHEKLPKYKCSKPCGLPSGTTTVATASTQPAFVTKVHTTDSGILFNYSGTCNASILNKLAPSQDVAAASQYPINLDAFSVKLEDPRDYCWCLTNDGGKTLNQGQPQLALSQRRDYKINMVYRGAEFALASTPNGKCSTSVGRKQSKNSLCYHHCPTRLVFKSATANPFNFFRLRFHMTRKGFFCNSKKMYISIQRKSVDGYDGKEWVPYVDSKGTEDFLCDDDTCDITLDPYLKLVTEVRLILKCADNVGQNRCSENSVCHIRYVYKKRQQWYQTCYGTKKWCQKDSRNRWGQSTYRCQGFKPQLSNVMGRIQVFSAESIFGWNTTLVKGEGTVNENIEKELSQASGPADLYSLCPRVMSNCVVDAHFGKWDIRQSGRFKQDPEVDQPRVKIGKWSVIVSKKVVGYLAKQEGIFEKRMVCIASNGTSSNRTTEHCCVSKRYSPAKNITDLAHKQGTATLKNL